jgi:hypothetical protein
MRWIKHPCNFSRSAAMSEIRERFGAAGYGAVWLILERIAEDFAVTPQKSEPDLCISEKDWRNSCGLSAQKLHDLLEILQNHGVLSAEKRENRIRVKSSILALLLDEWTKRTRKKTESCSENPCPEQTREDKDKIIKDKDKNRTEDHSRIRGELNTVLERHGLFAEPERARRIIRHMEQKNVRSHGAYLEKVLQKNPAFDPGEETTNSQQTESGQGPVAIGEVLRREGWTDRGPEQ